MFINISNHPSEKWSDKQRTAALQLGGGDILDIPFPNIPPEATEEHIRLKAKSMVADIIFKDVATSVAMVQGETSLVLALVPMLKVLGIPCVVACSARNTIDNPDGSKTVKFDFVQFRTV